MYNVQQLYNLTQKPFIDKISLQLLQEYYETYLNPFSFCYTVSDGNTIELRFLERNFPHLCGLETVAKKRYSKDSMLKRYRGDQGYNRIKSGEIDFQHLKNLHKKTFLSLKDKLLFFYQIPHIITSPSAIFRYKKVTGSNIQCEILIYDLLHGVCSHIGIEKDSSGLFYIPRTFFIERNSGMKFIKDQDDQLNLIKIEQIEISSGTVIKTIEYNSKNDEREGNKQQN